jgi:hypothetical protein
MMDAIAGAESPVELAWLCSEVWRQFGNDPQRPALERLVDEMLQALEHRSRRAPPRVN